MPEDVQSESFDCPRHFFEKRVNTVERPMCSEENLRGAVALLRASRRPLVVAGGGVLYSDAAAALEKFATITGVPVARRAYRRER